MTNNKKILLGAGVGLVALAFYIDWKNKQPKKTASFASSGDGKCKKACLELFHICLTKNMGNCNETYQDCLASCSGGNA